MSPTRAHSPHSSVVQSSTSTGGSAALPADATDAVQATDARLAEAIEHIAGAFIILDRTWRFTYVNRNAVRPIDLLPEDVVGRNLWEMFPEFRDTATAEGNDRGAAGLGLHCHDAEIFFGREDEGLRLLKILL